MGTRLRVGSVTLFVAVGIASALVAQEMQPPVPVKEHELLRQFEGDWDLTSKFTMEPGKEPMASKGKETARIIAGGLFLVFDVESDMMGQKFVGHGTMGYDVQKRKFTGSWIDSMATGVYLVEGAFDEKGKVLTEWMEGTCPQTGQDMKMRMVHEIKDKDSRVLSFFMSGPDGKEMQTGTIEYKRRK
jgi:hypothetical protein